MKLVACLLTFIFACFDARAAGRDVAPLAATSRLRALPEGPSPTYLRSRRIALFSSLLSEFCDPRSAQHPVPPGPGPCGPAISTMGQGRRSRGVRCASKPVCRVLLLMKVLICMMAPMLALALGVTPTSLSFTATFPTLGKQCGEVGALSFTATFPTLGKQCGEVDGPFLTWYSRGGKDGGSPSDGAKPRARSFVRPCQGVDSRATSQFGDVDLPLRSLRRAPPRVTADAAGDETPSAVWAPSPHSSQSSPSRYGHLLTPPLLLYNSHRRPTELTFGRRCASAHASRHRAYRLPSTFLRGGLAAIPCVFVRSPYASATLPCVCREPRRAAFVSPPLPSQVLLTGCSIGGVVLFRNIISCCSSAMRTPALCDFGRPNVWRQPLWRTWRARGGASEQMVPVAEDHFRVSPALA